MRNITILLLVVFLLSACGGAPTSLLATIPTNTNTPALLNTPTVEASHTPLPQFTVPPITETPSLTPSPRPTLGPTPTDTLLPTVELPTLAPTEPVREVWDGAPTYLADSQPGYYFRLRYDPLIWAVAEDTFGQYSLIHRTISYCTLTPAGSRGMSPGMQVDHDFIKLGDITYEINIVLFNGVQQFITYQGSDGVVFTGFELNFVDDIPTCRADAEIVLATLQSVPEKQATPVP